MHSCTTATPVEVNPILPKHSGVRWIYLDASLFFSLRDRGRAVRGSSLTGVRSLITLLSLRSSVPICSSLRGLGVRSSTSVRRDFFSMYLPGIDSITNKMSRAFHSTDYMNYKFLELVLRLRTHIMSIQVLITILHKTSTVCEVNVHFVNSVYKIRRTVYYFQHCRHNTTSLKIKLIWRHLYNVLYAHTMQWPVLLVQVARQCVSVPLRWF